MYDMMLSGTDITLLLLTALAKLHPDAKADPMLIYAIAQAEYYIGPNRRNIGPKAPSED